MGLGIRFIHTDHLEQPARAPESVELGLAGKKVGCGQTLVLGLILCATGLETEPRGH